jgi:cytidylate kinase
MAIITISRQVASFGDEIATNLAKVLGYRFIGRKDIEQRIVSLGFPEDKLHKYDERKPGFLASLAKDRDEYLDYLETAVLEAAADDDCVLIGRGTFVILNELPHRVSVRLVADDEVRLARLMKEFSWDVKQAQQRITESDTNRSGFHKTFFNLDHDLSAHFHAVINTALVDIDTATTLITTMVHNLVSPEQDAAGKRRLGELLEAQLLVNKLIFDHHLNIYFLRAVITGDTVRLQGIADSAALAEKAVSIASTIMQNRKVESGISIVQDFRAYP